MEGNKNPRARIVWVGGGLLFLAMILMCVNGYQRYGFWLFGLAIVVLIVGAVLARGDVDAIDVSAVDLVISPEEIRVGEMVYTLAEVSGIELQVVGYDGMVDPDGYTFNPYNRRRGRVNGMDNYLNFQFGGEKQEWQFYLPGESPLRSATGPATGPFFLNRLVRDNGRIE